jgi:hypothetical protein
VQRPASTARSSQASEYGYLQHPRHPNTPIKCMGLAVQVEGPGVGPAIAKLARRHVPFPFRGFELREQFPIVDLRGAGH